MSTRRTKLAAVTAAAAGMTGLALLATSPAGAATGTTAAAPAATAAAAACDRTPWEAPVQGYPSGFGAGSAGGDYLFHTTTGFHLRVTHAATDRRVYTGTIHASAPMRMDRVRLEAGDSAVLSKDRQTIAFAFVNHGHIDGVDFHTDCAAQLEVARLHVGNEQLTRDRVYLGAHRAHPAQVPFSVHRIPTPAT